MKTTFKQTINFLSEINYINRGGCGVAALALFHAAKKEGKDPKIYFIYSSWDQDNIKTNEAFLKGKRKKATSCHHVVVKIGNRWYDAKGTPDMSLYFDSSWYIIKETPLKLLKSAVDNPGVWNPDFERKKFIPIIERFVGVELVKKNWRTKLMKKIKMC